MNRVRWLDAQWPSSIRAVGKKLVDMPFTEESMDGFVIERIRDDFIEGRYIEKYNYQEVISTPFGSEEVLDRIGYRTTEFTLFNSPPHIELRNYQRSLKELISRLLEACSFNLVVAPPTVNLIEWVSALQDNLDQEVTVNSLQVSDVEIGEGVTGKILLKGVKDVREATDLLLSGRKHVLEKVQVKFADQHKTVAIQLSSSGTAKLPAVLPSDLLRQLRVSFPRRIS
ncbi:hypothetical protein N7388_04775 [Stutzerimonas stutzeri]|jgi:hypothetical protein|uniref:hypothetical protein n=1 Tax=Stutzerimonas stutzeri TaxID=316 RepID=UPI000C8EF963|nr:hypothetical protein [Stutzerimonas stutzeri]MAG68021.1 hypothetical protein [Pseudomonadales bacterium]MDH0443003.1 hypothetical protein [Stutzerimonas stutzeri]WBL61087.1 hypothetical protein LQF05_03930 [Stutzerimonas stutzeri]|tara:strand:- start:583 stop:1263 length:681 start_codon:yes stop_codon:yes gene_type:complete